MYYIIQFKYKNKLIIYMKFSDYMSSLNIILLVVFVILIVLIIFFTMLVNYK